MTTVAYNSVELQNLVGSFNGGLTGAPAMLRASQRSKAKAILFTFAQSAGTGNIGDTVAIAKLFGTDILLDWMINSTVVLAGANVLMNIGAVPPDGQTANNSKFDSAIALTNLGIYRPGIAHNSTVVTPTTTSNLPLQVGTDPAGDQTTGQGVPNFGSGPVTIQLLFYNAGIANTAALAGYLLVGTGQ